MRCRADGGSGERYGPFVFVRGPAARYGDMEGGFPVYSSCILRMLHDPQRRSRRASAAGRVIEVEPRLFGRDFAVVRVGDRADDPDVIDGTVPVFQVDPVQGYLVRRSGGRVGRIIRGTAAVDDVPVVVIRSFSAGNGDGEGGVVLLALHEAVPGLGDNGEGRRSRVAQFRSVGSDGRPVRVGDFAHDVKGRGGIRPPAQIAGPRRLKWNRT